MCWSLAEHIKGVNNRIADLGSRDSQFAHRWMSDVFREARLRPDLFSEIQGRCKVSFSLDLFSDRPGKNSHCTWWCSPVRSAFEQELHGHVIWAFPPRELIRSVLEHLNTAIGHHASIKAVLLVPEDAQAPWFRPALLKRWRRVRSWDANSDLFRWLDTDEEHDRWRRGPRTDLRYNVLRSWK